MQKINQAATQIFHIIHQNFLFIILSSYLIAVFLPDFGIEIRKITITDFTDFHIGLPKLMLAFLLFNAGLGVKLKNLKTVVFKPMTLLFGIITKICVPVFLVFILALILSTWHNPNEAQNILLGMIVVIAMPIANSTPTWTQNVDGNIALSLGLVFFSTMLSPIITPLIIQFSKSYLFGVFKEDMLTLIDWQTSLFLIISIVIPSLTGMLLQKVLGEEKVESIKPLMKLTNLVVLILLIYSNASISLPQIISHPDLDYHFLIIIITIIISALMFISGFVVSSLIGLKKKEQVSFVFATGMSNNGAGLILLSAALPQYPEALLPLIFFNLFQQIFASTSTMFFSNKELVS